MSNSFYDLNIGFEGDEPDPAKLPVAIVEEALAQTDPGVAAAGRLVLIEKLSMADAAVQLGVAEGEIVARLQQAQFAIGMQVMAKYGRR